MTERPPDDAAHHDALRSVFTQLVRLEEEICGGRPISGAAGGAGPVHRPAWLRPTAGETRWAVAISILAAIGLQLALPDELTLLDRWFMPALELALLVALFVATPRTYEHESAWQRKASLTLSALVWVANGSSSVLLVVRLVTGGAGENAGPLLGTGVAIWLTNVIAFALWYWQFDRGGPAARAHGERHFPDFLFVQMQNPEMAPREWEPGFVDYLYLSFTNATAFSPTDVMPMTRWAKLTMLVQSSISLVTVALVVARAVNILK